MKVTSVKVVLGLILACVLCGCGGGGGGTFEGESVRKVSSEPLGNNQYKYLFEVNSQPILGSKKAPFVMGQFTCWQPKLIYDVDGDGWYEVEIRAFNQEMRILYGGDFEARSFASIENSQFYHNGELVFAFKDGAIFKKGETAYILPSEVAGATGDNYVKVGLSSSVMAIYFNNQNVCGSTTRPFHSGSYNNEAIEKQAITDSSGWGKVVIPIGTLPKYLEFRYGGDNTSSEVSEWSWVTVSDSSFFDKKTGRFKILVGINGTVEPGF